MRMLMGAMMDSNVIDKTNTYHILIIEISDHQVIEWSGNFKIMVQEDGESCLDISFNDQPVMRALQEQDVDYSSPGLSIDGFQP